MVVCTRIEVDTADSHPCVCPNDSVGKSSADHEFRGAAAQDPSNDQRSTQTRSVPRPTAKESCRIEQPTGFTLTRGEGGSRSPIKVSIGIREAHPEHRCDAIDTAESEGDFGHQEACGENR
jgi:hypothetical protein